MLDDSEVFDGVVLFALLIFVGAVYESSKGCVLKALMFLKYCLSCFCLRLRRTSSHSHLMFEFMSLMFLFFDCV